MEPADADRWTARALEAWAPIRALVHRRGWRGTGLRDGPWPGAGPTAVWGLSQVLDAAGLLALLGAVEADEVRTWFEILGPYRDRAGYAPFPGDRPRYYDDNAWVGLAAVQAHLATGETGYLSVADHVLGFLRRGERDGAGGIRWVETPARSCHTCSTAPTGELATRWFLLRGAAAADDLALATRTWGYLARELRGPDGLYADNRADDGTVDPAIYSYNQGTPVGLAVLLARAGATDADLLLADARRTADAGLDHFGAEDRLWQHAPCFNGIFLRNLALLDAVAPHERFRSVLAAHVDRLGRDGRNPATGWFTEGGIGSYERGGVLDQAGVVALHALAALVALGSPRRDDVC